MHHIHIGAIPITKPAKQSYAIPTSKLKTPKTLSSGLNFVNLNFAKIATLFWTNSNFFWIQIDIKFTSIRVRMQKLWLFYCKTHFCNKMEFAVDSIYCHMHLMHLTYALSFDSTNHIDLQPQWPGLCASLNSDGGKPTGRSMSFHNFRSKFTKLGHRSIWNNAYLHMHIYEYITRQHWFLIPL